MSHYEPKILVVDDDEAMRMTLAELLWYEGFDVTTAIDGHQGVEMATTNHFDLIFMDFMMPGINGVEALGRIKAVSPETIVIMVTAYSGGLIEQALDEGSYAVLYKPFEFEQLANMVRTTLKSTCVLVFDNQPETRKMVREILEKSGFRVSEAEDGEQAVTMAGEKRYDVILMDAVMPGIAGFDACEKIVKEDPDAKVIFLAPHSAVGWVRQAFSAGAFSLLKKPIDPEDMISLMNSILGGDPTGVEGSVNKARPRIKQGKDQPR